MGNLVRRTIRIFISGNGELMEIPNDVTVPEASMDLRDGSRAEDHVLFLRMNHISL